MKTTRQHRFSRRQFLQFTDLAASTALLAACPAPAPSSAPGSDGEGSMEVKKLEAWSRMTDLAQESIKEIIDIYDIY